MWRCADSLAIALLFVGKAAFGSLPTRLAQFDGNRCHSHCRHSGWPDLVSRG